MSRKSLNELADFQYYMYNKLLIEYSFDNGLLLGDPVMCISGRGVRQSILFRDMLLILTEEPKKNLDRLLLGPIIFLSLIHI